MKKRELVELLNQYPDDTIITIWSDDAMCYYEPDSFTPRQGQKWDEEYIDATSMLASPDKSKNVDLLVLE